MIRYWTCNGGPEPSFVMQRTWGPYGPAPDWWVPAGITIEPMGSFGRRCPVLRAAYRAGVQAGKWAELHPLGSRMHEMFGPYHVNPYVPDSALGFLWEKGYRRGVRAIEKAHRHHRLGRGKAA